MTRIRIRSILVILAVLATGAGLAGWKLAAFEDAAAEAASQPEPIETVTTAVAREVQHRAGTTAIGTVVALRSITLRNELPGTVRDVALVPGEIVEAGRVLVAFDVSVEEAELEAAKAQAALAESTLARMREASLSRAASESEVDQALSERDVAVAQIARIQAVIARKTIRAPFRVRVGISDVHPGQFLEEGALLTTLQGVDRTAYVDFAAAQNVAAGLRAGQRVEVYAGNRARALGAEIVAVDARVDPATRNAMVRAEIRTGADGPAPGASVRVEIPTGTTLVALAVPVSALRKGPTGDHVFVVVEDTQGAPRAQQRPVLPGPVLGDEVLIVEGLAAGEQVAASGSFKLHEGALVVVADDPAAPEPTVGL